MRLDPLLVASLTGFLGAVAGGPAVERGLRRLAPEHRRRGRWRIVLAGLGVSLVAALRPGGTTAVVLGYALAALPGMLIYLVSRSILVSAFVSLVPLYFVIGALTSGRPTHTPETVLDGLMPVEPGWTLVYGSLYVFSGLLPILVVRQRDLFLRAMRAYLFVMLVSYAGFLVYPTLAPRPEAVPGEGFAAWSLRLVYDIDPPHGCFPSLHVAYSFVSALACFRVHRRVGVAAALWAGLIGVSTVYTKQHYAIDAIAGALLAFLAYALFLSGHARDSLSEAVRRRAQFRALIVPAVYAFTVAGFWLAWRVQAGAS